MSDLTIRPDDRLIRLREVQVLCPFSKPALNAMEQNGLFPKRIRLGTARVFWIEREILEFLQARRDATEKPVRDGWNAASMAKARAKQAEQAPAKTAKKTGRAA